MCTTRRFILALAILFSIPALATEMRKVLRRSEPVYPEIARRIHMTGKVEVEVLVDRAGNVADAKVVSGNSMLATSAITAAKAFKYEPGDEATVVLVFDFHEK